MSKLKTPLNFVDGLSAFNTIRPLTVRETLQRQIALTVGNVKPVGIGRPATVKMLSSNNVDSQLIQSPKSRQNQETIVKVWGIGQGGVEVMVFSQWFFYFAFNITGMTTERLNFMHRYVGIPYLWWDEDVTDTVNWSGNSLTFSVGTAIQEVTLTVTVIY